MFLYAMTRQMQNLLLEFWFTPWKKFIIIGVSFMNETVLLETVSTKESRVL
jgi:hypothetical protein